MYLRCTIGRWNVDLKSEEAREAFGVINDEGLRVFRSQPGFIRYRLRLAETPPRRWRLPSGSLRSLASAVSGDTGSSGKAAAAQEERAGLVGIVADSDDIIEGLSEVTLQRLGVLPRDIQAYLVQHRLGL